MRLPAKTAIALHDAEPVVFRGSATLRAVTRLPSSSSHSFNTSEQDVLQRWVELTQYVSIRYTERLDQAGIRPSVGSRGDSYDNALAETINGLYKAELIHRRGPWKTRESVELATLQWVHWFNHVRLLTPIGGIPPAEAEANYWRQLAVSGTSPEAST